MATIYVNDTFLRCTYIEAVIKVYPIQRFVDSIRREWSNDFLYISVQFPLRQMEKQKIKMSGKDEERKTKIFCQRNLN